MITIENHHQLPGMNCIKSDVHQRVHQEATIKKYGFEQQQQSVPQLLNVKCCVAMVTNLDLSYSGLKSIPKDVVTSMKK